MENQLFQVVDRAVENLCRFLEGFDKQVLGIGIMTIDSLDAAFAAMLFEGDLGDEIDDDTFFNPNDWVHSEEFFFEELNGFLRFYCPGGNETSAEYDRRAECFYSAFEEAFKKRNLHAVYGEDLFITVGAVDPNGFLLEAEDSFIKNVNSPSIYQRYCAL